MNKRITGLYKFSLKKSLSKLYLFEDFKHILALIFLSLSIGIILLPIKLATLYTYKFQENLVNIDITHSAIIFVIIALSPFIIFILISKLSHKKINPFLNRKSYFLINDLADENKESIIYSFFLYYLISIIAIIFFLPIGNEILYLYTGSTLAIYLKSRFKILYSTFNYDSLISIASCISISAAFNIPILGPIFLFEYLYNHLKVKTIVIVLLASVFVNQLINIFSSRNLLEISINIINPYVEQFTIVIPIAIIIGLSGAYFHIIFNKASGLVSASMQTKPKETTLLLALIITIFTFISFGASIGNGLLLTNKLVTDSISLVNISSETIKGIFVLIWIAFMRFVAPLIVMLTGFIPGIFEPAMAFGGVIGMLISSMLGVNAQLGLVIGVSAGLGGFTQLPLISSLIAWSIAGNDLLPVIVMAASLSTLTSRLIKELPYPKARALVN